MNKSFKEFRVESICSTFNPELVLEQPLVEAPVKTAVAGVAVAGKLGKLAKLNKARRLVGLTPGGVAIGYALGKGISGLRAKKAGTTIKGIEAKDRAETAAKKMHKAAMKPGSSWRTKSAAKAQKKALKAREARDKQKQKAIRKGKTGAIATGESFINEAPADDYVADKAIQGGKLGIKKFMARVSPTDKARIARVEKKEQKAARKKAIEDRLAALKNKKTQEDVDRVIKKVKRNILIRKVEKINKKKQKILKKATDSISIAGESVIVHEQAGGDAIINNIRTIVKTSQSQKVKLTDGKQILVDMMTANAVTKVYDALNPRNKVKFASRLTKNRAGFLKMAAFAIKNISF